MFFYAIDCKSKLVRPVELNPKPRAITATYNLAETSDDKCTILDNTSTIEEIEHNVWIGEEVQYPNEWNKTFQKLWTK